MKAVSNFAIALGLNIPTGKDSLSMTQKYPGGEVVISPGTVIISAVGEVSDVKKVVSPCLVPDEDSSLFYIPLSPCGFEAGGSSFAQVINQLGDTTPDVQDASFFAERFALIQQLVSAGLILAGHDVGAGGLITTLLEMTFTGLATGLDLELSLLKDTVTPSDPVRVLFSEKPAVVIQVKNSDLEKWKTGNLSHHSAFNVQYATFLGKYAFPVGRVTSGRSVKVKVAGSSYDFDVDGLRDTWFKTSYLFDRRQSGEKLALERYQNYKKQPLAYRFPAGFTGTEARYGVNPKRRKPSGIKAAIIREKGVNRDRDMAWALYLAGFDVKDVHMTDLIAGRENLEDVNMIAFVGGFSNSDVLGSAKGWAGAFLYNDKARLALDNFYRREDTLSLGVCNGCQLMVELGLIYPEYKNHPKMSWNDSHKYECTFVGLDIAENNSVMVCPPRSIYRSRTARASSTSPKRKAVTISRQSSATTAIPAIPTGRSSMPPAFPPPTAATWPSCPISKTPYSPGNGPSIPATAPTTKSPPGLKPSSMPANGSKKMNNEKRISNTE